METNNHPHNPSLTVTSYNRMNQGIEFTNTSATTLVGGNDRFHHHTIITSPPEPPAVTVITGNNRFKDTAVDIIASVVGSAACVYTGQPFDTLKVRFQLASATQATVNSKNGIFSAISDIVNSSNGIKGLWRGSYAALAGALLENPVAFATNGVLKRIFPDDAAEEDQLYGNQNQNPAWKYIKPFVLGGITGACCSIVLCPCDIAKCRAQASLVGLSSANHSMRYILSDIFRKRGFSGLYHGMTLQVARDIPFYATFFGSYEILCQTMKKHTDLSDPAVYFISGGLAGQIGWICSIVPDTLKSRLQISDSSASGRTIYREIIRSSGIRGLFAGVNVAIIRAFPANAALFVGYEYSCKFLDEVL